MDSERSLIGLMQGSLKITKMNCKKLVKSSPGRQLDDIVLVKMSTMSAAEL